MRYSVITMLGCLPIMGNMKSQSRFYLDLVISLYRDIAERYHVASSVQTVEIRNVTQRFEAEGLSFLTKTLPSFGKAVDTALSKKEALSIQGLKTLKGCKIPLLFGFLTRLLFDTQGVELEQSSPEALMHFRQLVYLLYKLEIPSTETQNRNTIKSFIEVDRELDLYDQACEFDPLIPKAREIISRVLGRVDPRDIKPRHGPGAVSTGEKTHEKHRFRCIYESIEKVYPFTDYFFFSLLAVCDNIQEIQSMHTEKTGTAKVVLVPKDSRGPRLISCEPLEVQWIQQGLSTVIVDAISHHRLTSGYVNFDDQTVNQYMALWGSRDGEWVTLDMKEASDRVSMKLVSSLFSLHPDLLSAMEACRSGYTRLPDGYAIMLRKFAPMGSSLCFPVEALVFYALALSALQMHYRVPLRKLRGSVYIFGDDIIMRREDYSVVLHAFPRFGLKFNTKKCCTAGFFRESCGVDAYKGIVVTPTRLRTVWCGHRKTPGVLESYVALRNALIGRGYTRAAQYVFHKLSTVFGLIPFTDKHDITINGAIVTLAGGPAYYADHGPVHQANSVLKRRFNKSLFRSEVYSYYTQPKLRFNKMDDWSEVLRRFSSDYGSGGGVYALPRSNCLKRGWIPV